MKFDKSVDELVYQMTKDADILGRNWAMSELTRISFDTKTTAADKEKILSALRSAAASDNSWMFRRNALTYIGYLFVPENPTSGAAKIDDATVQVLLKAGKDANSLVRAEAISVLDLTKDPKFAEFYITALDDRSYTVIERAAIALAGTKNPKSSDLLTKLLNTPSWRNRLQTAALKGLSQLEGKRPSNSGG
jgi:hypothetical protein